MRLTISLFSSLVYLPKLTSFNKLHSAHQLSLHSLKRIREVDLSYNKLTHVPLFNDGQSSLECLKLSNNKIEHISENFDHRYSSLQHLDLSHNMLTSLPAHVVQLTLIRLEELLLGSNLLESLPPFPTDDPKFSLRKLDIKGNRITYEDARDLIFLELDGKIHLAHFLETVPQALEYKGIYIGSAAAARNLAVLKKLNVTHILNVAEPREVFFVNDFKHMTLGLLDTAEQDLLPAFPKAHQFIKDCIDCNGGVLIHWYDRLFFLFLFFFFFCFLRQFPSL